MRGAGAVLSNLAVNPEMVCWDIGAGTGSVGIEMAALCREVWAVEQSAEALALLHRNRKNLHAYNLHIIEGTAPNVLSKLPAPNAVFIGGSGGHMEEILQAVYAANSSAKVCVSAIRFSTLYTAYETMRRLGYEVSVTQLCINHSHDLGESPSCGRKTPFFLILGEREGNRVRQLMLAALHSGAGKTVVTCALLTVLRRRGMQVRAFKCGPDYIDPMFHSRVLGVPSRNIDLFLQGKAGVRAAFKAADGDIAIVEGAMGFYDGVAGTEIASAWAVAEAADIPVVLVFAPQGAMTTLPRGCVAYSSFALATHIAGVLLNDCKASLAEYLSNFAERNRFASAWVLAPLCRS